MTIDLTPKDNQEALDNSVELANLSGPANAAQQTFATEVRRFIGRPLVSEVKGEAVENFFHVDTSHMDRAEGSVVVALRIAESLHDMKKPGVNAQKAAFGVLCKGLGMYPKDIAEQSGAVFDRAIGKEGAKKSFSSALYELGHDAVQTAIRGSKNDRRSEEDIIEAAAELFPGIRLLEVFGDAGLRIHMRESGEYDQDRTELRRKSKEEILSGSILILAAIKDFLPHGQGSYLDLLDDVGDGMGVPEEVARIVLNSFEESNDIEIRWGDESGAGSVVYLKKTGSKSSEAGSEQVTKPKTLSSKDEVNLEFIYDMLKDYNQHEQTNFSAFASRVASETGIDERKARRLIRTLAERHSKDIVLQERAKNRDHGSPRLYYNG